MNTKEAIQAMLDGKKVRKITWCEEAFVFFDGKLFIGSDKEPYKFITSETEWEIYEEQKPVQTVTIEKWLCLDTGTQSYCICEESCIDAYINDDRPYLKKVKLLETYEVEL